MRYLIQSFLALAVLVAAPVLFEQPEELWQKVLAGIGALILVGLAYRGVVGYVHSKRPKRYLDSIMVDKAQPPKKDL